MRPKLKWAAYTRHWKADNVGQHLIEWGKTTPAPDKQCKYIFQYHSICRQALIDLPVKR